MSLSEELRRAADPIWRAQHDHPFVRGNGDGTLDPERFRFWVRQDYRFLLEYGRLLALGAARAPDLETMRRLADLCQATLRDEMDLHRSYAREFDISEEEELEAEPMAPTTQGYTDFLVRTAAQGDFAELVAALLPCMWGFSEIGQRLAEGGRPSDERYAKCGSIGTPRRSSPNSRRGAARSPTAWQASYPRKFGSGSPPPSSRAAATSSRSGRWRGRESAGSPNQA